MFHDLDYFEFEERDAVDFGFTYTLGEEKRIQNNPIGFTWEKVNSIILLEKARKKNDD